MKKTGFALILAILISSSALRAGTADKDIIDTATAAGSFNTVVTALRAADLTEALRGSGPFTVFAPTDDAFKPENKEQLRAILTSLPGRRLLCPTQRGRRSRPRKHSTDRM